MDINQKIDELLIEKDNCSGAERIAHARIIQIDKQVKALRRALKEVDEILNPGFEVVSSENGVGKEDV